MKGIGIKRVVVVFLSTIMITTTCGTLSAEASTGSIDSSIVTESLEVAKQIKKILLHLESLCESA